MIGLGICSGYILVFKMLKTINLFESSHRNLKNNTQHTNPLPNTQIETDIFRGRINEYGEIYDYGGASGKYLGRIKENGEIQNSDWAYTDKLSND